MKTKKSFSFYMRIVHRYLGFFLAGIMAVYALSGIVLIYRETDFLKSEKIIEKNLDPGLSTEELGKTMRIRDFKITRTEEDIVYFENGTYNSKTGLIHYTSKELPSILKKLAELHKATSKQPLYWLNVFFGIALFFFVVSSFFMFKPNTKNLREGIYISIAGIILTVLLLYI